MVLHPLPMHRGPQRSAGFSALIRALPWATAAWLGAMACGDDSGSVGPSDTPGAGDASAGTSSGGGDNLDASMGDGGTGNTGGSSNVGNAGSNNAGAGAAGDVGTGLADSGLPELVGAPLVFAPTGEGFGISAIWRDGDPLDLRAHLRVEGESDWGAALEPQLRESDLAEWRIDGLEAGTAYEYQIRLNEDGATETLYAGRAVTAREPGNSFSFALLTDSHIGADLLYGNQGTPDVLRAVGSEIESAEPDFMVNLGDMLDFHQYGFNAPPPDGSVTRSAYLNYRTLLGDSIGRSAHFPVIGNWEGENGNYTPEQIAWSREQRILYMPAANPSTYPEGGSAYEDYYAFTWGDALFVVLNVMTYTPTEHLLSSAGGTPEDWTLGVMQFEWLRETLENATSKWRFLLIHHAVGGAAGDLANSAYGRGGGQAAHVGEQALVHQLMIDHGVQIFFYGHDHVFTDMVVDDIHYSMPGSAGAPWMFTPAETGYEQSWLVSGWSKVDVTPDSVHVQFIQMGGELIYEYTLEQ